MKHDFVNNLFFDEALHLIFTFILAVVKMSLKIMKNKYLMNNKTENESCETQAESEKSLVCESSKGSSTSTAPSFKPILNNIYLDGDER